MITQTYTFQHMPKAIRENIGGARERYIQGLTKDLAYEFESSLFPPQISSSAMDVTGYDLIIDIQVDEADARFLEIALHNLHSGKLLQSSNIQL
jgi:hypothetical protein